MTATVRDLLQQQDYGGPCYGEGEMKCQNEDCDSKKRVRHWVIFRAKWIEVIRRNVLFFWDSSPPHFEKSKN